MRAAGNGYHIVFMLDKQMLVVVEVEGKFLVRWADGDYSKMPERPIF